MKHFFYHENNYLKPYVPQEDYFVNSGGIFIVADGVTHDLVNDKYPKPSEAYAVAKIAAESILKDLQGCHSGPLGLARGRLDPESIDKIELVFSEANQKIHDFQKKSDLYKNRENNNYTFGATVIAAAIIKNDKLFYGVLDDCSVAIFGEDGADRLKLIPYVEKSTKYLFADHSWENLKNRKIWRKEFRNHRVKVGNKTYGYGVLDGHGDYEPFLQTGEINIKSGDLICVYSDGFIKPLEDKKFVSLVRKMNGSVEDQENIARYLREKGINKEKSCYFIRIK